MKHPIHRREASKLAPHAFSPRVKAPGAPSPERSRATASRAASDNTRRAYTSDWNIFAAWCAAHGMQALPCSEAAFCQFNLARMEAGCSIRTVQRGMASIRARQTLAGHPDPFGTYARAHWRGLRKDWYRRPDKADPLLTCDVRAMLAQLDPGKRTDVRAAALLLVGFAAGLRRGNLVALQVDDLTFGPLGVTIYLRRSKTDQEGRGREVAIRAMPGDAACPVAALRRWLELGGIAQGYVFQSFRGPRRLSGRPMTAWKVSELVRTLARLAGVADKSSVGYSAHSLRRGCITELRRGGVEAAEVAQHVGHTNVKQTNEYYQRDIMATCLTDRLFAKKESK